VKIEVRSVGLGGGNSRIMRVLVGRHRWYISWHRQRRQRIGRPSVIHLIDARRVGRG